MDKVTDSSTVGFLNQLYDTSLGRSSWKEALVSLTQLTGGVCGNLLVWDKQSGLVPDLKTCGSIDDAMKQYAEHWVLEDPRAPFLRNNPDIDIYFDEQFISEKGKSTNAFFNEWERKLTPIKYIVGTRLRQTPTNEIILSVGFPEASRNLVPRMSELYGLIAPHLTRAIDIHQLFGTQLVQSRAESVVLEGLNFGVLFLDQLGRECYHNRKAREIIERAGTISLRSSKLEFRCESANGKYEGLLRNCRQHVLSADPPAGGWMTTPCAQSSTPYSIFVAPMPELDNLNIFSYPRVLVLISDPLGKNSSLDDALHELFGLTEGEVRVCLGIIAGSSTAEIAEQLDVSRGAIRFHLKNIFSKTGVSRQPELVKLLLTVPGNHQNISS